MTKFNKLFNKIIQECQQIQQQNDEIEHQPTQQEHFQDLKQQVALNNMNYDMYQNDAAGGFVYEKSKSKLLKETKARRKRIVKEGLFTGDNNFSVNFDGNSIGSNNDINVSDNNTDLSLPLPLPMESKKSKLLKETKARMKRIVKEGLFGGDNTFSVNFNNNNVGSNNDIDNTGNETKLNLPFAMEDTLDNDIIKCEICGKQLGVTNQYGEKEIDFYCEDPAFKHEHVCLECAEKEAQKYQNDYVTGADQDQHVLEFIDEETGNVWVACSSCGMLWPESELKNTDAGTICDDCLNGYISRGEEVSVNYNHY